MFHLNYGGEHIANSLAERDRIKYKNFKIVHQNVFLNCKGSGGGGPSIRDRVPFLTGLSFRGGGGVLPVSVHHEIGIPPVYKITDTTEKVTFIHTTNMVANYLQEVHGKDWILFDTRSDTFWTIFLF